MNAKADVTGPGTAGQHHDEMRRRFERALLNAPETKSTWRFRLCGRTVRVVTIGGHRALSLVAAFAHLPKVNESHDPELEIWIWDCESTGIDNKVLSTGEPMTDYQFVADENHLTQQVGHTTMSLSRDPALLIVSVGGAGPLPVRQLAKPFVRPLTLWLNDLGSHIMHAGLVSHDGRGILLVGPGGAGKSSTALACLDHGLQFLADDYCALTKNGDGDPIGHSIYATALVSRDELERYPRPATTAIAQVPADDQKAGMFFEPKLAAHLSVAVRIGAIGICQVSGGTGTQTRRATKAATLLALAPTSVLTLSTRHRQSFGALGDLIEQTPCFALELGNRTADIAAAVRSLVE